VVPGTTARLIGTLTALLLLGGSRPLSAQGVELAPFGGYGFGGDVFELATGRVLDIDGAPLLGALVDIPLSNGLHFEGLLSRQAADVLVAVEPFAPPARLRVSVDHWQGGGLQEFGSGRVRPFTAGTLGLTRYAAGANSEIRFSLGGGGGVKLFPMSHVGVRLDGRVFATLLDASGTRLLCGTGACAVALHVNVLWQAEFTAGLIVKLP
jgi:hypothetical protein